MNDDAFRACRWTPNLFVVGAPKCGTTSLCRYLGAHPAVFMPWQKEPLFFCTDDEHREPWRVADAERYLALYAPGKTARWRGDGSVWYLFSRSAAQRIHACSPDARIIVMLRNPVDMAVSLHAQFLFSGNESIRDFAGAYAAQAARLAGRRLPLRAHMPAGLNYTAVGRYAEQVQRYLEVFPPGRVKILVFEDFFADPVAGFLDVLRFLDLDADAVPAFTRENTRHTVSSVTLQRLLTKAPELWSIPERLPAGRVRDGLRRRVERFRTKLLGLNARGAPLPPLDPAIRRRLHGDFAADIARLETSLGLDLSAWRQRNLGDAHPTTAWSLEADPRKQVS